MQLIMLGTGDAMATECYNTCFALKENNQYFMVDGGGGNTILHQLKQAELRLEDMTEIFVTHKHMDHLMGIIWMVRAFCQRMKQGSFLGEVHIYAHEEVTGLIQDIAGKLLTEQQSSFIGKQIHLITVADGEQRVILGKQVTFFDIHSTKAKQFGFVMEMGNGKRLACCGDEPYNDYEENYVKGSTWLLHEAFCLKSQADYFKPYEKHHSTVKDACEAAERLGVKNLVLYHTEDQNLPERKRLYQEEGSRYYQGNLYIPEDLETMILY